MRREASSGVSRCGKQLTPVIILFAAAFAAALGTLGPLKSSAQGPGMSDGRDRLAATPWRPNQKDATYVGPQACAKCHETETGQRSTAMGRAMEPAAISAVLRAHPRLTFRSGAYSYEITRKGEQSLYTITDGTHTFLRADPLLIWPGQSRPDLHLPAQRRAARESCQFLQRSEGAGLDHGLPAHVTVITRRRRGTGDQIERGSRMFRLPFNRGNQWPRIAA